MFSNLTIKDLLLHNLQVVAMSVYDDPLEHTFNFMLLEISVQLFQFIL